MCMYIHTYVYDTMYESYAYIYTSLYVYIYVYITYIYIDRKQPRTNTYCRGKKRLFRQ